MKNYFILILLLFSFYFGNTQNCLDERFNTQTTGWVFSQGASEGPYNNPLINGCTGNDDDRGIITPGVGGNNPARIITPALTSGGGNTIQFSMDFFVFNSNLNCNTWKNFDCPTSINIYYHVGTTKYTGITDLLLSPNGILNPSNIPVTFSIDPTTLPRGTLYQIEIEFNQKSGIGNCIQQNTRYVIDNFRVCEQTCIPGASPTCGIDAIDDNYCLRGNSQIDIFAGDLSSNDLNYNSAIVTYSLASGPFANGEQTPGGALLVINPDGTFILTRIDLTKTSFNFTYRVCDPNGVCDLASVQICFSVGGPLPITLSTFSAIRKDKNVQLTWKTVLEINAKGFEIERQDENGKFIKIGYVAAVNNSIGNSYSFIDINLNKSISVYRLKMIDVDNTIKYSQVISIKGLSILANLLITPNPSLNGAVKINIPDITASFDIQLLDNLGKIIRIVSVRNSSFIMLNNLRKGVYLVKIINRQNGSSTTEKLIVSN